MAEILIISTFVAGLFGLEHVDRLRAGQGSEMHLDMSLPAPSPFLVAKRGAFAAVQRVIARLLSRRA